MLSSGEIEAAKSGGTLFPVKSPNPWMGERRSFLMCCPLRDALEAGKSDNDEKERKRWAQLEAAMIHFVENGRMNAKLIKQLIPEKYEHWELISRKPRPSYRVFGRFALPDVFVGTHVKLRKGMGGMWSPQFEHEKLVCEGHFKDAGLSSFFSSPPDFKYEAYITENASREIRIVP